jgi:hypothetical protein
MGLYKLFNPATATKIEGTENMNRENGGKVNRANSVTLDSITKIPFLHWNHGAKCACCRALSTFHRTLIALYSRAYNNDTYNFNITFIKAWEGIYSQVVLAPNN